MQFKVPLRRKDKEIETTPCIVEKTIELSESEYVRFCQNLLDDYDFILENIGSMYQDTDGVSHCLLVLGVQKTAYWWNPKAAATPAILLMYLMPAPLCRWNSTLLWRSSICRWWRMQTNM